MCFDIYLNLNDFIYELGSIMKFFSKSWGESGATLISKVDVKFDDVQGV